MSGPLPPDDGGRRSAASASLEAFFSQKASRKVMSAYLFGSHAEQRTHRESDIDVGVLLDWRLVPSRLARAELRLSLSSELIAVTGNNFVDIVVLNDAPPQFARSIVTLGSPLFVRDPELDHAFRRDIQLLAADLTPWLDRMRRIKLKVLQQ